MHSEGKKKNNPKKTGRSTADPHSGGWPSSPHNHNLPKTEKRDLLQCRKERSESTIRRIYERASSTSTFSVFALLYSLSGGSDMKQNNFCSTIPLRRDLRVHLQARWQEWNRHYGCFSACHRLIRRATHQVVCHAVYMNQNFTFEVKSGFTFSIWGKFLGNKTGWTLVQVICHRLKCHIIPVHLYDWWCACHAKTNKHALTCFSRSSSRRWLITRLKGRLCRKTGKTHIFLMYSICNDYVIRIMSINTTPVVFLKVCKISLSLFLSVLIGVNHLNHD